MFKKKEQKELETIQEPILVVEEDGMEVIEMLEAEQELGMLESKNKVVETKRKANADGKPPPKRKKLENLEDWGMLKDVEEDVDGPEDNPKTAEIKKWLIKVTPKKDSSFSNLGVGRKSTNDNPIIKLKQM